MKNSKQDHLKRIIVDFKKLTPEVLSLLVDKYPYGYDDEDIIKFKNSNGVWIQCVQVSTETTKYLVKVSTKLEITMSNYDEEDYKDFENDDPNAIEDFDIDKNK